MSVKKQTVKECMTVRQLFNVLTEAILKKEIDFTDKVYAEVDIDWTMYEPDSVCCEESRKVVDLSITEHWREKGTKYVGLILQSE